MSKRFPPARYVLPAVIDPPDTVCFVVNVPNDPQHIAAFKGQIYDLAWQKLWARDNAHLAKEVAAVWQRIFDNLEECKTPDLTGTAGAEGDENLIRQNPDNPCELQTSIDGTNWCTFADLSLCIPAPAQPAHEAPQPPAGGGQACYDGVLQANSNWLLPTPVSSGDVLDLQNAVGAGSDGTPLWYCPTGEIYFAGDCQTGTAVLDGGDPDSGTFHMGLIWVINGVVYLDASHGPVTVPGGVVNGTCVLQVNDGSIAGNFGSYQFKACVTNNASLSYEHVFDFLLGTQGWTHSVLAIPPSGVWTGGVGWVGQDYQSLSTDHFRGVEIQLICPGVSMSGIEIRFDFTAGFYQDGAAATDAIELSTFVGATQTYRIVRLASVVANGTNKSDSALFTGTGITKINLAIRTDEDDTSYAGFSGASVALKVIVSGPGPDPF